MSHAGDSPLNVFQRAEPTSFQGSNLENAYAIPPHEVEFSVKRGIDTENCLDEVFITRKEPLSAHRIMSLFDHILHEDISDRQDFGMPRVRIISQTSQKCKSEVPNAGTSEATLVEITKEHGAPGHAAYYDADSIALRHCESLTNKRIFKVDTGETTVNILFKCKDIWSKPLCTPKLIADDGLAVYQITVRGVKPPTYLHEQITLKMPDCSKGPLSAATSSAERRGPALLGVRDGSIVVVLVWDILMLGRRTITVTGAPEGSLANRASRVFIVDSGAAVHATGDRALLFEVNMERTGRAIRVASGHSLEILGHGSVYFGTFTLRDVKYVPGLTKNVISVSQLLKQDYTVDFRPNGCFIRDAQNQVVGHGRPVNGLFELDHAALARLPA